jgi:hypothetical protein
MSECPQNTTRTRRIAPSACPAPTRPAAMTTLQRALARVCRVFSGPAPVPGDNIITFANEDVITFAGENVVLF